MTANTSFTYPMFILLLLMAFNVSAQRIYDGSGRFIGRVDSDKYYDGSGRFIGRIDKDKVYDGSGRFLGRIDKEKLYDSSGKYQGRVDGSRLYDSSGRFVGRIDGNKIYDGSGRFIARTEGLTQKQIVLFFYFYSFYDKDTSPANIFHWGLALKGSVIFFEFILFKNTFCRNNFKQKHHLFKPLLRDALIEVARPETLFKIITRTWPIISGRSSVDCVIAMADMVQQVPLLIFSQHLARTTNRNFQSTFLKTFKVFDEYTGLY